MSSERWADVDRYLTDAFIGPDPHLAAALADSTAAGLPEIHVSAPQGKLLHLLARMHGARKVLELGTLAGYSTIWLARAIPGDGSVITLESDPHHAAVAQKNLQRAGVGGKVQIRIGPALQTLPKLAAEGHAPFDFIFIDADKPSTPDYFAWALKLSRVGSVIVVDNVVRDGNVTDASSSDPAVQGIRRFIQEAGKDPRVTLTAIQTVGAKGYDGFALAIVQRT